MKTANTNTTANTIANKIATVDKFIEIVNSPATTSTKQNDFDFVAVQKIVDSICNTTTKVIYAYTANNRAEKNAIATAIANKPKQVAETSTAKTFVQLPKRADYIATATENETAKKIDKKLKLGKILAKIAELRTQAEKLETEIETTADYAKEWQALYIAKMQEASKTPNGKKVFAKTLAEYKGLDKNDLQAIFDGALAKTLDNDFDKEIGEKLIKSIRKIAIAD